MVVGDSCFVQHQSIDKWKALAIINSMYCEQLTKQLQIQYPSVQNDVSFVEFLKGEAIRLLSVCDHLNFCLSKCVCPKVVH